MLPTLIPIQRVAHSATHCIGRHEGGLFMGFACEVFPEQKKMPVRGVWYAVMHFFTSDGAYVRTEHFRQSPAGGESAQSRLGAMIRQMRSVSFESIAIAPFDTKIDGTLWGLVLTSNADTETEEAELRPLGLIFSDLWTGGVKEKAPNQSPQTTPLARRV